MSTFNLTIYTEPITNNTKFRQVINPITSRCFISGYKPAKVKKYEELIRSKIHDEMIAKGIETYSDAVETIITVGVVMPKAFSKKRRSEALGRQIMPIKRPDLDNYIYLITNCLKPSKKYAYKYLLSDDSIICRAIAEKVYAEESFINITVSSYYTYLL